MAADNTFSMADSYKLARASNYGVWKIKMKTILREKKHWQVYVCPGETRLVVELVEVTTEQEQEERDQALTIIVLSLKEVCFTMLQIVKTPKHVGRL